MNVDIDINNSFEEICSLISERRERAYQSVNSESIFLNWEIGSYLSSQIDNAAWGNKTISNLADYIKERFPALKGFDRQALSRMVQFYKAYTSSEFVGSVNLQIESKLLPDSLIVGSPNLQFEIQSYPFVKEVLSKVSWTIHLKILSGCTTPEERLYYLFLAIRERLSYREMQRLISSCAYERTKIADKELAGTFLKKRPDAQGIFKDSYMVDFLGLKDNAPETDLHKGLVQHMKQFILDLGQDFLFVGDEYRLKVGLHDYFLDLLFFHRKLRCFIAFELKMNEFQPEYLGQLDFYLEALDSDVKHEDENPSIGVLLCKTADKDVVEYALRRSISPALVAKYKKELIPKEILQKYLSQLED